MVTLTVTLTNDTFNGLYRVTAAVTAATDISSAVFTFSTETGEFSRVATAADVGSYPTSRTSAQTDNLPYYRQAAVTRSFTDLPTAQAFSLSVLPRLKILAKEHQALFDAYLGTQTTTVTSE